jgi:carboxyl-terminal processing protease
LEREICSGFPMNGIVVFTLLVAPAAPVPGTPPPAPTTAPGVDRGQVDAAARLVENLAQMVRVLYVKEGVTEQELFEAAIRGMYDEAGLAVPDAVKADIRAAKSALDRTRVFTDARVHLGNHPNLAGSRTLFAAINGFKYATDPICSLASPRVNTYASVDQDFGVGIELDGVVGPRWTIYQVEHGVATGRYSPVGYIGQPPKADVVPSPAVFPWRVKRVVPGSPAQKAGVKPGDVVTHFNGTEVTAENANKVFAEFAFPRPVFDPQTGMQLGQDRTITFHREGEKPFSPTLKTGAYNPESAFGVIRTPEDKWDCMLDRKNKIGYIRVGPIEAGTDGQSGTDVKVAEMMADLTKQGCRGVILDLRWCPGGYVSPGTNLAGLFLKPESVIADLEYRNPQQAGGQAGKVVVPPGGGKYADVPLVVLVGQETTGGGELIASALRDNDRCVVIGQRTVGRASIQTTRDAGFAGVQFRITAGTSLRPNGKNRQKFPDSQPTDDWGVRPDEGLEVPVTADKSAELRRQADLHALRPADSREALPFDDPAQDPYRLAALAYLRKKLGPPK